MDFSDDMLTLAGSVRYHIVSDLVQPVLGAIIQWRGVAMQDHLIYSAVQYWLADFKRAFIWWQVISLNGGYDILNTQEP